MEGLVLVVVLLLAAAIGAVVYFLPTIIAFKRGKRNRGRYPCPQPVPGLVPPRLGRFPGLGIERRQLTPRLDAPLPQKVRRMVRHQISSIGVTIP